jgi:hypothetical protein
MGIYIAHNLSLRAQTLIETIAKIDRIGGDIMGDDTCHEPGDVEALAQLLDDQAFDWAKDRFGEGISIEATDAMSVLASRLRANIEREEEANSREACRIYHDEMARKSAAAMGGA